MISIDIVTLHSQKSLTMSTKDTFRIMQPAHGGQEAAGGDQRRGPVIRVDLEGVS